MSFGIVRIQKCKRQAVTGIGIHNQRQKEKSNTNPDIDRTKSQENYYLEGEGVSFTAEVNRRLEGASGSRWGTIRKDAVVLAEALVTSDSSFFASLPQAKIRGRKYLFRCRPFGRSHATHARLFCAYKRRQAVR